MKTLPVLIIKNEQHESGGLIETVLQRHKIAFQTFDLKAGDVFPEPEQGSALVVLGGPDSANDKSKRMQNEVKQVRKCLEKDIPYLGICLGLQVMVKAAGGQVVKSPVKETGFFAADGRPYEVEITFEGAKDPIFQGFRQRVMRVFQLHGETVVLTPELRLLGIAADVPNQIVRAGSHAYGIQCHFELTPELFANWLEADADLSRMDRKRLEQDFDAIAKTYQETGTRLIENFLKIAGLLKSTASKAVF